MGLKRFALLGLGAAGAAYFKKKENRDKARAAFEDSKVKVSQMVDDAKKSYDNYKTGEKTTDYSHEDDKMMSEGAQTSVQYYNEQQEDQEGKPPRPGTPE
ncbi:hypothetical protein KP77_19960 [Jeotgalibacillus alimentarius]|uniref:Uncharacterized protein n=1 Tax=Jeotgalibacillus alimentarius TaxID=135826 RepID=A0A0C2REY7_9BACL|nr:hypothetical protein [Jeotgalibacillus alimentarius]KIL48785.1 hypothetical protein KP77_19960 [Jeotgalibacillus alimentarius]